MDRKLLLATVLVICAVVACAALVLFIPNQDFAQDAGSNAGETFSYDGLKYRVNEDGKTVTLTGPDTHRSGELKIPEKVINDGEEYAVTIIGEGAFRECEGFTGSLTIPNSVMTIGNGAFHNCIGFTSLIISESVKLIGESAFERCTGFTGTLTLLVLNIGTRAFYGCSGFTSLIISEGVRSIGESAFDRCTGFKGELILPSTVTSIGNFAFWGCSGFKGELILPSTVTSIGDSAFWGCSGFKGELTIPSNVTSIGDSAFWGCSGFTGTLTLLGGDVKTHAFWGCSGFTGLTISEGVRSIGEKAFEKCAFFKGKLTIPSTVTSIGNFAFFECSGFTGLTISEGVRSIGDSAFDGCTGFRGELILPSTITSIGMVAFWGCGFTDLTVFGGNLGRGVFSNTDIQHVTLGKNIHTQANSFPWKFYRGDTRLEGNEILGHSYEKSYDNRMALKSDVHTIYFDTAGGTKIYPMLAISKVNLPANTPTLAGYTFLGWSDGGSIHQPGDVYETDRDVTLYALWEKYSDKCILSFDLNGGEGYAPTLKIAKGEKATLPFDGISRKGYAFVGWECNGHIYTSQEREIVVESNMVFKAVWDAEKIHIKLDSDGEALVYYDSSKLDEIKHPSGKDGYICLGYYHGVTMILKADGTFAGNNISGWIENGKWKNNDENIELTAKWEPKKIVIKLDVGASGDDGEAAVYFDSEKLDRIKHASRPGYILMGYYYNDTLIIKSDGSFASDNIPGWIENGRWIKDGIGLELTAKWDSEDIILKLKAEGGVDGEAKVKLDSERAEIVKSASKEGYTVLGYCDGNVMIIMADGSFAADNIPGWIENGKWVKKGSSELIAKWDGPQYEKVKLIAGTGTDGEAVVQLNSDRLDSIIHASRAGYAVTGYYDGDVMVIKADGTFAGRDITGWIENGKWIKEGLSELIAKWTPVRIVIKLDVGTVGIDGKAVVYFDSEKLESIIHASRTGYALMGYYYNDTLVIKSDGSFASDNIPGWIENGRWIKDGIGLELNAKWEPKKIVIKLDVGAVGTDGEASVYFDSDKLDSIIHASRPGYILMGYYCNDTLIIKSDGSFASDNIPEWIEDGKWIRDGIGLELTAKWDSEDIILKLKAEGGVDGEAKVKLGSEHAEIVRSASKEGYTVLGYCDGSVMIIKADGSFAADNIPGWIENGRWIKKELSELTAKLNNAQSQKIELKAGTGIDGEATVQMNSNVLDSITHASRIGYSVQGYYDGDVMVIDAYGRFASDNISGWIEDGRWVKKGPCELTAKWTPVKITIKLDVGTIGTDGEAMVYFGSDRLESIVHASREGGSILLGYCDGYNVIIDAEGRFADSNITGWIENGKWIREGTIELTAKWIVETSSEKSRIDAGESISFIISVATDPSVIYVNGRMLADGDYRIEKSNANVLKVTLLPEFTKTLSGECSFEAYFDGDEVAYADFTVATASGSNNDALTYTLIGIAIGVIATLIIGGAVIYMKKK